MAQHRCTKIVTIGLVVLLFIVCFWTTNDMAIASSHGKAMSLKTMQKMLQQCHPARSCSDELRTFAGMTHILGYVVDPTHRDVIIIGAMDDQSPALYLDDFIVALRNAWLKYADLRGNTYYYASPGCSIDPDPQVIQRLQGLSGRLQPGPSSQKRKEMADNWQRICQLPQTVRVLGIPFNSHFGRVLVEADYDMKMLVDGSVQLNLAGFQSLPHRQLERLTHDIKQGAAALSIPQSSMNRFWFYPGNNTYLEAEGIATIEASPVTLLTEAELLDTKGQIRGQGREDPFAAKFAQTFTGMYADIARQRPVYRELENLFRMVSVAKALRFKKAFSQASLTIDYLLDHYPIASDHVPRQVPGRSNFLHTTIHSGAQVVYFWLPTCGGVDIAITIDAGNMARNQDGELSRLKDTVIGSRPTTTALHWNYPLPGTHVARRPQLSAAPAKRRKTSQATSNQQLQQMLQALGYYLGALDGIIGPQTRKAVQAFQTNHDLTASGQMNSPTYRQLTRSYDIEQRLQQANTALQPGERPAFVVQAVSSTSVPRYIMYTGTGQLQTFHGVEELTLLLEHAERQRASITSSPLAFNLELVDFSPHTVDAFAFNVQVRYLVVTPDHNMGIYVRTAESDSDVNIQWIRKDAPRIQRDSNGYVVQFAWRDIILKVVAKTREALIHLLSGLAQIFFAHPDYMALSAKDMARAMQRDIEVIRQRLKQQYGEDGDSQINFRDQVSNITISKIKKQNQKIYVSWEKY